MAESKEQNRTIEGQTVEEQDRLRLDEAKGYLREIIDQRHGVNATAKPVDGEIIEPLSFTKAPSFEPEIPTKSVEVYLLPLNSPLRVLNMRQQLICVPPKQKHKREELRKLLAA